MPRYSDLFAKQPAPARGGRLSALSREELQAYVDDVAPTFAQRFGNEVRANAPPNYETGTLIERGQRDLARMGQPMTLDQAAVATAGVPGLGDVVGLAADARAVYDDPSWVNIGGAALGALPFVPAGVLTGAAIRHKGKIYSGRTHRDAIGKATEETGDYIHGSDVRQGFVDDRGRFYDRGDPNAALEALTFNQIRDPVTAQLIENEIKSGKFDDISMIADYLDFPPARVAATKPKGIRAFHGSPHDFDRFDISKIGTGEGAQAYGHGLYFAEAEDTAKAYRDGLTPSRKVFRVDGQEIDLQDLTKEEKFVVQTLGNGSNPANFISKLVERDTDPARIAAFKRALEKFDGKVSMEDIPGGRMYEVNINADPDDFVNFDGRLQDQPEAVKRWLEQNLGYTVTPDMDGGRSMSMALQSAENRKDRLLRSGFSPELSNELREAGIPGIRYLDQGSRAAGEGSRNYVVFDDALIDIIRKYGIGALLGGSGAFGLMSMQGDDGTQPPL